MKQQWCIAPRANAEFVSRMEDVLEVYTRPYNPQRPLVCMDEGSKQLLAHGQEPLPLRPGQPERFDYEYERKDVANLFLFVEPLAGKRHIRVTLRRTKVDWALAMKDLADVQYPQAEVIVVVMDNLNVHSASSFYEAFEPQEARRLTTRFEFHHTPKHGSWLNIAEIELSVLGRQCLSGRIPEMSTLASKVQAWQEERNASVVKVRWHFTTADARIKLAHLYPRIHV